MGPLHTRGELLLQRPHGPSGAVSRLQMLFIPESRSFVTIYFPESPQGDSTVVGTSKLRDLYERFEEELGRRQERAKAARPKWEPPKTKLDEDPGEWSHRGFGTVRCGEQELFLPSLHFSPRLSSRIKRVVHRERQ